MKAKAHLNSFSGATINTLDHFITPVLEEDRPEINSNNPIGSNVITHIIQSIILTQKASQHVS